MININLGSGPFSADGWINFDFGLLPLFGKFRLTKILVFLKLIDKSYNVKWPKFRYFDIRHHLPFTSDSVDNIYCSNVLEHFDKFEVIKILSECRRLLGRKGLLRVVLPDLKKIIENYSNSDNFCREFYGFDKDLNIGFITKIKSKFIRGHQWMYDVESFVKLLNDCGFERINIVSFKKGRCPNIDVLDLPVHERLCFYVEATA